MASRHQVLAVLSAHVGWEKGITVRALADQLGISEREVRKWVSELREEGVAVIAHPSRGYAIARDAGELEQCCEFLRSRAMHSLHLEAQMRRVSLADLVGQLRIKT